MISKFANTAINCYIFLLTLQYTYLVVTAMLFFKVGGGMGFVIMLGFISPLLCVNSFMSWGNCTLNTL